MFDIPPPIEHRRRDGGESRHVNETIPVHPAAHDRADDHLGQLGLTSRDFSPR
jgi:hypothetical protein